MKYSIAIVSLLILFTSCSREENKISSDLQGEFRLVEILVDPGDGSGTFIPISSMKTIRFGQDFAVESNGNLCDLSTDNGSMSSGTYQLADSVLMINNCGFDIPFSHRETELFIYTPCIEPCVHKYKREQ